MEQTHWNYQLSTDSCFCQALVACGYLTEQQMRHAAERYKLGRSRDGGVIFWQIDQNGRPRDGKIMYYREDCHRDKSPYRHPTWISALLKKHYDYPDDLPVSRCLFGLHLLNPQFPKVAIVESEKTAVILSEFYPQYLWMATGGLSMLSTEKLLPLRKHHVILFPDTDPDGQAFTKWKEIAEKASQEFLYPIYVSPILECHATLEQKLRKIDLADFIGYQPNTPNTHPPPPPEGRGMNTPKTESTLTPLPSGGVGGGC